MFFIADYAVFTACTAIFIAFFIAMAPGVASAQPAVSAEPLRRFSSAAAALPPEPWRVVGLPASKVAMTQFDIVPLEGKQVLRLLTDKSYGTLSHALPAGTQAGMLRWQWRLEKPMPVANLLRKEGDDAPLKVCAMFDLPLEKIGFYERNLLRLARSVSGEHLPGATLCYVWDHKLPAGSELPNAYTKRLRFVVLDSGTQQLGQWVTHTRDLRVDFLKSFGTETDTVPPLLAILVGADGDNTASQSLGYLGDMSLMKQ
jgi:hypothetical protein